MEERPGKEIIYIYIYIYMYVCASRQRDVWAQGFYLTRHGIDKTRPMNLSSRRANLPPCSTMRARFWYFKNSKINGVVNQQLWRILTSVELRPIREQRLRNLKNKKKEREKKRKNLFNSVVLLGWSGLVFFTSFPYRDLFLSLLSLVETANLIEEFHVEV